ncbi:hypothetical protein NX059_005685 [Plenodomus lindquistii]|nr:hypothetical protein NX059_005685 [Plenodomus lindquistii]
MSNVVRRTHRREPWLPLCNVRADKVLAQQRVQATVSALRTEASSCVQHTDHVRAVREESEKKAQETDKKLTEAEETSEQNKATAIESERLKSKTKTYCDFCDTTKTQSDKVDNAAREMKSMVKGEKTPQRAFEKWEKTQCQQLTQLVSLWRRVESAQDDQRREHAENWAVLQLDKDRKIIIEEQHKWRLQQSRKLEDPGLEHILEARVREEVEDLKLQMEHETARLAYFVADQDFQRIKNEMLVKAKDEGYACGYNEAQKEALGERRTSNQQDAGCYCTRNEECDKCELANLGRSHQTPAEWREDISAYGDGYIDGREDAVRQDHQSSVEEGRCRERRKQ